MKTILVTGGAGTIGSGLVKSLHRKNYNVICQDISEYNLYKIKREIPDVKISCGDLKDIMYVDKLFKRFAPDTVYHCAAYKHVDLQEEDFDTVWANNVMPIINITRHQFDTLILLSTDKAVNPKNNMGRTKHECEVHVRLSNKQENRKIVRFGNVYGSSGSFIETMEWQINNNIPVTITDKDMTRNFISLEEAVKMLETIIDIDDENGTYIYDMGEKIKIIDLVPDNYPIKYIGIRPGEKIEEVLYSGDEEMIDTSDDNIKKILW